MKKFIWLILLVLIVNSCVKFDKLGMPSWEMNFQVNILNDNYDVNQVADSDSSLYVENDILKFTTSIADSVYYDNVTIQSPVAKQVSVSLSSLSDDVSQLNGLETVVPTFSIQPLQQEIPNYNEFQEITFESAEIKFTIQNDTDIYLGNYPNDPLIILLLNRETGAVVFQFFVEQNIAPHTTYIKVLDLSGYTFPNSLTLQMEGGSIGSNGETITVDTSQPINIGIELLDFKMRHVIAQIPYQELSPHTVVHHLSVTFPHIVGTFSITSNSSINFQITSPIPAQTLFELIAVNPQGETDTLKVNGELPVLFNTPGITDTTFYSSNSNLNNLLSILPEKFEMVLYPAVGDSTDTIYEISNTDMTKIKVTIDSDLNLDANCWIIPRDDDKPNISATNVESFDENKFTGFINGGIKMNFNNLTGTQLGMDLLAANQREYLDSFDKIIQPDTTNVTIFSIPLITTGQDSIDYVIYKKDLEVFLPDSVYIVPRIKMVSNATEPLSNGIDVKAKVHMKVLISKDLLSNDNSGE